MKTGNSKLLVRIFLLLLASLQVCACPGKPTQTSPDAPKAPEKGLLSACSSSRNPFLALIASEGVKINPKAVQNKESCVGEWNTYGNCCEVASLKKLFEDKKKSMEETAEKFEEEARNLVESYNTAAKNTNDVIHKVEKPNQTRRLLQTGWYTQMKASGGLKSQLLSEVKKKAADLGLFASKISELLPQLTRLRPACISQLTLIRSASLCDMCSGRSEDFFRDGKLMVKMSTCDAVLMSCHDYWKLLIEALDYMRSAQQVLDNLQSVQKDAEVTSTDYLYMWLGECKILESFKSCQSLTSCTQDSKLNICGALINIKKTLPMIKDAFESVKLQKKSAVELKIPESRLKEDSDKKSTCSTVQKVASNFAKRLLGKDSFKSSSSSFSTTTPTSGTSYTSDINIITTYSGSTSTEPTLSVDIKFP